MTFHLYEDTWETSITTGTGDYVLGGAASGWRPFSAQYVDTNTTWYSAFDGINFEHGIGTYNSGPNTLSRTTVLRSTNGGNPVVWTSGVRHIVCAPLGIGIEQIVNTPGTVVSATAPVSPKVGTLWFDTVGGQLYVWYDDGTSQQWVPATNRVSGLVSADSITTGTLSAQRLNLGMRLAANGTQLNALGPTTTFNNQAAAVNAALDGAMNYNSGSVPCTWNLPAITPGMVLGIYCGNQTTITPAGSDLIIGGGGPNFTNASPMVIPLTNTNAAIYLVGRANGWDILSLAPKIADVLGWVSRPYFDGYYSGANLAPASITWTKIPLQNGSDSHGWFDGVNLRYVPKRVGTYQFTIIVTLGDATTGQAKEAHVALYKNSALNIQKYESWNGTNYLPQVVTVTLSTITVANGTTDYFEAYIYINAPNPFVQGGGTTGCEMIIRYLGP